MPRRRRVREVVIQVLYQLDLHPDAPWSAIKQLVGSRLNHESELTQFAYRLIRGVEARRDEIDQRITETATHWHIRRLAAMDRAILRLATYEILSEETPGKVAINEAIELAKRFSTAQSAPFVNGVLDCILKTAGEPVGSSSRSERQSSDDSAQIDGSAQLDGKGDAAVAADRGDSDEDSDKPQMTDPETQTPTTH